MAQLGDFFARLISASGTRGLSGDTDLVLPGGDQLAWYNSFLRRHRADGDLVGDPERLWEDGGLLGGGALRGHVLAERADGVLAVSDLLVVVNSDDWQRSLRRARTPWATRVVDLLLARFGALCEAEDLHLLFPQRRLGIALIEDGGPEMQGGRLGLTSGEFVTGLLPNQYVGPQPDSQPVITVHMHLPGAWKGYRQVGRLHSDQGLFTLGNHWLDNFHHPALPGGALYRLQQYADGSFLHILDPELRDAYRIRSQQGPGPEILTIESAGGAPVAHLVLAVTEAIAPAAPPRWDHTLDEFSLTNAGTRPKPAQSRAPSTPPSMSGNRTVVPAGLDERMLTLRERGALLQRVHFSRFMDGYDVHLGPNGQLGTRIRHPVASFQVRGNDLFLQPLANGVRVNRVAAVDQQPIEVRGDAEVSYGPHTVNVRDLRDVPLDGWPYLAELSRPASVLRVVFGARHRIGRDRRCAVRLPDQPANTNIVWKPAIADGATIRSRNGDIPKSRFYIDSIMVASEHAELDLTGPPALTSLARHCYSYVRRDGAMLPLFPTRKAGGPMRADLRSGDELLVGNCVFKIEYDPPSPAEQERPDMGLLTPDDLAAAASFTSPPAAPLPEPTAAPRRGPSPPMLLPDPAELPDGAPPPLEIPASGDSILGAGPFPDAATRADPSDLPDAAAPPMALQIPSSGDSILGVFPPRDVALNRPLGANLDHDLDETVPGRPLDPGAIRPGRRDAISLDPATAPDPIDLPTGRPPPMPLKSTLDSIIDQSSPPSPRDLADLPSGAPPPVFVPSSGDSILGGPDLPGMRGHVSPYADFLRPRATRPEAAGDDPSDLPDRAPPPPVHTPGPMDSILGDVPPDPAGLPSGLKALATPVAWAPPMPDPPRIPGTDPSVVVVDESSWQMEMARPARLVLEGWMVSGQTRLGNHHGADVVLPENRATPDQRFTKADYLTLQVRGRRARITRHSPGEVSLMVDRREVDQTDRGAEAKVRIVRRDAVGEEDFHVGLRLDNDSALPDPRARMLGVDLSEPMTRALLTHGLARDLERPLALGGRPMTVTFDGSTVEINRTTSTGPAVFIAAAGGPFRSLPEGPRPISMRSGDRLMVGRSIYRLES